MFVLGVFLAATTAEGLNGVFWQISDMHFDQYYAVGSPANCISYSYNDYECCRNDSVPSDPQRPAGKFGDHNCDSPLILLNVIFEALRNTYGQLPARQRPDFIIWTGDNDNHHKHNQSQQSDLFAVQTNTALFKQYLPQLQVFPTVGNLDTYPDDVLSLPPYNTWLTSQLSRYWNSWITDPQAQSTLVYGGYYTQLAAPGLRIVSLNSLANYTADMDVAGQWSWLNATLASARAEGEKVWIMGHIDPEFWDQSLTSVFQDIITEYESTVKALIWGHTHKDQFNLVRSNGNGTVVGVNMLAPSVEPAWTEPSYRVFNYNVSSMALTDLFQYTASLEALNNGSVSLPQFVQTYSFRQAYGMTDMSNMTQWEMLAEELFTNATTFQTYWTHFSSGYNVTACTDMCRICEACTAQYLLYADRLACVSEYGPSASCQQ